MKDIKISELKKHLKELTKDDLEKEILALVKNYKEVKEYFSVKLNPNNEVFLLEEYKNKILMEFFPKRGFGKFNFTNIKKAISDYKKLSNNSKLIADLIFYAVENGVDFTNQFGDITEKFYISIENIFDAGTKYIVEQGIVYDFLKRCDNIVTEASGIGWGFSDTIEDIYYGNLSDFIEFLDE